MNKQIDTLRKIEHACKPIKFANFNKEHVKSTTVQEFISNELFQMGFLSNTIYVENLQYQCHKEADRSIGDIYQLCKYYFPETTVIDVIKVLFKDVIKVCNERSSDGSNISELSETEFVGHHCCDINKRVWNLSSIKNNYKLVYLLFQDEYGLVAKDYIEIIKNAESSQVASNISSPMIAVD